jgi:hypothetical protein
MTTQVIYPELNQVANAQIEFTTSYNGGSYITTSLQLSGRGIRQTGNGENHKRGLNTYHVTEAAMTKIKSKYTTTYIASL